MQLTGFGKGPIIQYSWMTKFMGNSIFLMSNLNNIN